MFNSTIPTRAGLSQQGYPQPGLSSDIYLCKKPISMHYFCIYFPLVGRDTKQMLRGYMLYPDLQHPWGMLVDVVFAFPPTPSPPRPTPLAPRAWLLVVGPKLQITGEQKPLSLTSPSGKGEGGSHISLGIIRLAPHHLPHPQNRDYSPRVKGGSREVLTFGELLQTKPTKCHFFKPPSPPTVTSKTRHLLPGPGQVGCQHTCLRELPIHMPSGAACHSWAPVAL